MDATNAGELGAVVEELAYLRQRVDELTGRVAVLEGGQVSSPVESAPIGDYSALPGSNEGSDWLSGGVVLQRLAVISFILVFALLLRTVTDYGYINLGGGTLLGLVYVTVLVGIGFRLYQQRLPLAPIFAGCGFLLLFAIVVESLNRFAILTTTSAVFILLAALGAGSFLGIRFAAPRLLAVTVIGVAIAGLAGNFPRVVFPAAGGLLLAANLVAALGARRQVSHGLRGWVTLLTLVFWALWGFKIAMTWRQGQALMPFYIGWYLPLLLLFGLFQLLVSVEKYYSREKLTAYDAVLPSLNMLLLFLAGRVLVVNVWAAGTLFGALAMVLAGAHLLMGWGYSVRDGRSCAATGGAMVAGALMVALGLPQLLGGLSWALPGFALVAYGLARLSGRCDSAVIRVLSYLYQFLGLAVGVVSGVLTSVQEGQLVAALTAALALGVFSLAQYHWCRQNPPGGDSLFFRLDDRDHTAVVLLLCGLGGLYFFGALLLENIAASVLVDAANTIRCGRSLLINLGVLALLLLGSRQRSSELLWVAAALAVVGCLKIFFGDLFKGSGLPLVLSVLSFGVVAATGSVIMGKLQRQASATLRE
ncbi:MAG: hypothetical protein HGA96_16070 [Desulfobulbaceae bacterium]|nr:hypothetical protein [Desulfobulbaceae bacterium]